MKSLHLFAGACVVAVVSAAAPATAQVRLNVCRVPPLPLCERPRVQERVISTGAATMISARCAARARCAAATGRGPSARCTCEDDEGEEVLGQIVR
jgi:hypothetical protein